MEKRAKHLIIGGIGGVVSRTCVAPLERLKILYQTKNAYASRTYINNIFHIIKNQGYKALFSGNGVNCLRVMPKSSIQFMSYKYFETYFSNKFLAGGLAGLLTSISVYPLETIRTRLSVDSKMSVSNITRSIYNNYGLRGFYRGLDICLIGSIPLYSINFGLFHYFQQKLGGNTPMNNFWAGSFSILGALCIAYPSDLLKHRMQIRGEYNLPMYKNWRECGRHIIKTQGVRGLYSGFSADCMKMFPANGIFFVIVNYLNNMF